MAAELRAGEDVNYRLTSGERAPGTHWAGGWVDPKAGQDVMENQTSLTPAAVQPVARCYTDWAVWVPEVLFRRAFIRVNIYLLTFVTLCAFEICTSGTYEGTMIFEP
jgi:hypothetical protein